MLYLLDTYLYYGQQYNYNLKFYLIYKHDINLNIVLTINISTMSLPKNGQKIYDFADTGVISKGILEVPMLWNRSGDKFRYWQVFVGIAKKAIPFKDLPKSDNEGAWKDKVDFVKITNDHLKRKELADKYVGVLWTNYGDEGGKNTISKPSFVAHGKNEGKANFTTPFTQAVSMAMTQFNGKTRKGHVTTDHKDTMKGENETYTIEELMKMSHRGDAPWRVHVMAVHDVSKANNWRHVNYPCEVQPKYDGVHFITVCHPKLPPREIVGDEETFAKARLDYYSRGKEQYEGQDHILGELYPILVDYPGLHLVGELWKEGYGLQDISGSSRRIHADGETTDKTRSEQLKLNFNIFDAFYIDQPNMPFTERWAWVETIFENFDDLVITPKYCMKVPTYQADNKKELTTLYQSFIADGHEGGVIRNTDSPYEVGVTKEHRSYQTLKIKPRFDEEFAVVGFKQGKKGKDKGAIIWICEAGKEFSVTPNWPQETRYEWFKEMQKPAKKPKKDVVTRFDETWKGQMATISYATMSTDKVPQQPKFLRFRKDALNSL